MESIIIMCAYLENLRKNISFIVFVIRELIILQDNPSKLDVTEHTGKQKYNKMHIRSVFIQRRQEKLNVLINKYISTLV